MVGAVNAAGDIVLHRGGAGSKAVGALRQTSDLGLVVGPVVGGAIADSFSYSAPFIAYPILMLGAVGGRSARSRGAHAANHDGDCLMRVALISDIHGNRVALETVLAAIERDAPDQIVCLGDVAAMGPDPGGTLDLLRIDRAAR